MPPFRSSEHLKVDSSTSSFELTPCSPGIVATDMGEAAAASFGTTTAAMQAISPEKSARSILSLIDVATKKTHGGKFWDYTGTELRD